MDYTLNAEARSEQGKGASRRLRRVGKVPAIVYGGDQAPQAITLEHKQLVRNLEEEGFYSQLISIRYDDNQNKDIVILRDLQRHPAQNLILHADLQRVDHKEKLRVVVPIHLINEEECPGLVLEGGNANRILVDIEISCLPKDIPEYLILDILKVKRGDILHLSDVVYPDGVESTQLTTEESQDLAVFTIF